MVRDLDMGVEIVGLPTIREADGLAMSSRNQYLSAADRESALRISNALFAAINLMTDVESNAERIIAFVRQEMNDLDIDYISLVDGNELTPIQKIEGPVMLAVAATIGKTRLIDNIRYEPSNAPAHSNVAKV